MQSKSDVCFLEVHNLGLCVRASVLIEVEHASPRGRAGVTGCKIWKLYSSPVALTLAECSSASHGCFSALYLPPLLHRCSLSPRPDAGALRCAIGHTWAAAATLSKVAPTTTHLFIVLPKRTNRRLHCWGAENSALPNMCSP